MRRIYLVLIAIMLLAIPFAPMVAAASEADEEVEEETTIRDFSLRVDEGVRIGDYRVELISVISRVDGLIEVKVWKRVSTFEDWRVMEILRDANFDEGADRGGLTITVIEIFDEDTVRMRAKYRSSYGYPQKYITERGMAPKNLPELEVTTALDRKDVSVGDEVKVTITVNNIGNATARDVAVQDSPPLPAFRYVAGYPPKIKNSLEPGESDVAVYSMVAATEGDVTIPATVARYADSKSRVSSASSQPQSVTIKPKRKPDLVLLVEPPQPISYGGRGTVNVTVKNQGDASAYMVEVKSNLKSVGDGLEVVEGNLDRSFLEIPAGGSESYSTTIEGSRSGSRIIDLLATFQADGAILQKETTFEVMVLERELRFLYFLPIVPVLILAAWLFRRYKEYKY
ncbi:MAG: CARDB domain-containing protein [Methanothrix sp.]|jgi:uncharacterized repeat protein (TIGR01451 family)|nr:CARDB domain-containing protein [Methanothrix sp.]OPX79162.1 MAG: Translocon-associated protein beta (TRAPB) [Methanosaeta sp. PtaB.Bin087]OPY55915.1 MAG: Translocon-associated protein beta (TRAPB) [Methanosaeta sp. PtaU1.Bin055]NLX39008.1 DUF11 domain-containing protein [Methanothrix sp.]HNR57361.1 CARDB domain-containing protein [Methanothrix sp.]